MLSGHERLLALLVVVLYLHILGGVGMVLALQRCGARRGGRRSGRRRALRPRPADDCPACRAPGPAGPAPPSTRASVPPWPADTRRGRPRQVVTAGRACPEPTCPYFGITDAAVHA